MPELISWQPPRFLEIQGNSGEDKDNVLQQKYRVFHGNKISYVKLMLCKLGPGFELVLANLFKIRTLWIEKEKTPEFF